MCFVGLLLVAQVPSDGRLFYVRNYGADPTGDTDSTHALLAAINAAFNVTTVEQMMPGVPDLGGVEIHLEGGNYLISEPLRLPASRGGNVLVLKLNLCIFLVYHIAGLSRRITNCFRAHRFTGELCGLLRFSQKIGT